MQQPVGAFGSTKATYLAICSVTILVLALICSVWHSDSSGTVALLVSAGQDLGYSPPCSRAVRPARGQWPWSRCFAIAFLNVRLCPAPSLSARRDSSPCTCPRLSSYFCESQTHELQPAFSPGASHQSYALCLAARPASSTRPGDARAAPQAQAAPAQANQRPRACSCP